MISSRLIRPLVVAALALGLVAGATPASASPNVGVLVGTGTYYPGIPTSGCAWQHWTFDGTLVVVGTNTGIYQWHWEGDSTICESAGAGAGSGQFSGDVTGTVLYSRTGTAVTLTGSISIDGGTAQTLAGALCWYTPTSVGPTTTSYAMTCVLVT